MCCTHFGGELLGVGHHDQGDVFVAVEFDEQVSKRFGGRMIKCAGGFVGENEAGSIDQCAHDSNALAFPAGELGWSVVDAVFKSDPLEELLGACEGTGRGAAGGGQRRYEYVFEDGALRQQVMGLKNNTDLLASNRGKLLLGEVREFLAV